MLEIGAKGIRQPAVAGRFYPDEPRRLQAFMDEHLLPPVEPHPGLRALVVPHAGFRYSGATAALAFGHIQADDFDRVVVIAPTHYIDFHGLALPSHRTFSTPLGNFDVDCEICRALLDACDLFSVRDDAHRLEHGIEVELPFLQRLLPAAKLIPIVCGAVARHQLHDVAATLHRVLPARTLLVISSDFTHYGARYRYQPFPVADAQPRLEALDRGAIAHIAKGDARGFLDYVEETGATICGWLPIGIMLTWLQQTDQTCCTKLVDYTNSGQITGSFESSVSYASLVVHLDPSVGEGLNAAAEQALLGCAREAINCHLTGEQFLVPDDLPSSLYERGATFVTLYQDGSLRGCIGSLEATTSLVESVSANAVSAAVRDPRFPPLQLADLQAVCIAISCLTPTRPIPDLSHFQLGRHGLVLERDGRRAVFLPQVATEQGWDAETTAEQLCLKAGLSRDAWRHGASLQVFESRQCTEVQTAGR